MPFLFWGYVVLFAATVIFYLVFVSLIYYWHEKKTTVLIVPLLYTFEFFLAGFLVVSLVWFVFQYLPETLLK